MDHDSAIILIGMPASGKSTVGGLLARRLGRRFVDTDTLIETMTGEPLQATLDREGYLALRQLEERAILAEPFTGAVVATGGSAVYSAAAMAHLQQYGPLVFLDIDLPTLAARLNNFAQRGIASAPGENLADIYADRQPRYVRIADYRLDVAQRSETEVVDAILEQLDVDALPSSNQ